MTAEQPALPMLAQIGKVVDVASRLASVAWFLSANDSCHRPVIEQLVDLPATSSSKWPLNDPIIEVGRDCQSRPAGGRYCDQLAGDADPFRSAQLQKSNLSYKGASHATL